MRYLLPLFVILLPMSSISCENSQEWRSRQAVRQLIKVDELNASAALNKVVAFGEFALVEIEQEFHGAKTHVKLRLLDAIRRIKSPKARPLLKFIGDNQDEEENIRKRAKEVLDQIK